MGDRIIEVGAWLATPPGQYLLQWELQCLDAAVTDAFGFHALQMGLPQIEALRANRMPHRWVALDAVAAGGPMPGMSASLYCEFDALPFPDRSIDLVVLPHTLEFASDPHRTLAEVERVLVPEGRLVVAGFNPRSLWGVRQHVGRGGQWLRIGRHRPLYMPRAGEFIGYGRLHDWMALLSLQVERTHFGCWAPPVVSPLWLQRWSWMDRVGSHWWPVLGAAYVIEAVKRVRGMRMVMPGRRESARIGAAPAAVTGRAGVAHRADGSSADNAR